MVYANYRKVKARAVSTATGVHHVRLKHKSMVGFAAHVEDQALWRRAVQAFSKLQLIKAFNTWADYKAEQ